MSPLNMDEAHRADYTVKRDCLDVADQLDKLATGHRIAGSNLAIGCSALASTLRAEAAHIVAVWD